MAAAKSHRFSAETGDCARDKRYILAKLVACQQTAKLSPFANIRHLLVKYADLCL